MASGYAVAGQASEIPRLDGDGFVHSSMDAPGGGDARSGLCLAMSSSLAIGASFIVKKKGLKLAGARRAGYARAAAGTATSARPSGGRACSR